MVSAFVEAWLRKPTYADFLNLRDDTSSVRGWWRNRVCPRVRQLRARPMPAPRSRVWIAGANLIHKLG